MSLLGDGQKRSYASTPFDKASSSKQSKPSPGGGLNQQQQHALELALSGHSIFLTGGAGTGKSFTLKRIIKALQGRYGEQSVMITAATGMQAQRVLPPRARRALRSDAAAGVGNYGFSPNRKARLDSKTTSKDDSNCLRHFSQF